MPILPSKNTRLESCIGTGDDGNTAVTVVMGLNIMTNTAV